jgi:hypothetical protein
MGLKFRRGSTAQQSGSLAFGEPYVNTTLGTLVVGGASGDIVLSAGGTGSTGNFGAISGSGLDITGNANIAGNLTLGGAITIGDATADTVNVIASLSSSLIPQTTNAFDLGSAEKIWKDLYISTGSIKFVEGTTVVKTLTAATLTALEASTGSANVSVTALNSFTSSIDTTIKTKMNTDGVVSGSSQITYASISSIPAGIVSGAAQVTPLLPTGTISGSSQLSGTSITDLTIINLTTVNQTASVVFSSGSNRFGDAGNDTHAFTGSVQISGSLTTIGTSTATSFNGAINSTNGVVSGSSQITYASISSIPSGIVSGSSQITAGSTTGFATDVKTRLDAENVVSGSKTISGITLGSNLGTLTIGTGLSGTSYNGSTGVTIANTGVTSVTAGTGISRDVSTGGVTITNTGVTSNVAGTGISLSGGTGAVTITNSGVTSLTAGTGVSVSGATGGVTVSIGQAVATSSSPTFAGLTINGAITATGDITAYYSSDRRFKSNIQLIPNALEKVTKLNGVTWTWNEDVNEVTKTTPNTGLIAQEVQEVLPEVVMEREDGHLGLDYSKMMGLLVEAIKEQQTQIHSLTLEIEKLKELKGL